MVFLVCITKGFMQIDIFSTSELFTDQEEMLVYIFHNNVLHLSVGCLSKTTNSGKLPPCHFLI